MTEQQRTEAYVHQLNAQTWYQMAQQATFEWARIHAQERAAMYYRRARVLMGVE